MVKLIKKEEGSLFEEFQSINVHRLVSLFLHA